MFIHLDVCWYPQEELKAALGQAEEESVADKSDDDDASSVSSFFGLDKSGGGDSRRRSRGSGVEAEGAATPSVAGSPRRSPRRTRQGPERDRQDKSQPAPKGRPRQGNGNRSKPTPLASAQQALQSLEQASPPALWQGKMKDQELQARLKKAGTAIGELQQFQSTLLEDSPQRLDCERTLEGLSTIVAAAPLCRDVFAKLKSKGPSSLEVLQEAVFKEEVQKLFKLESLDTETASGIVVAMGQKLIEAHGRGYW